MSKEKLNDKKHLNNNVTSEIWIHNEFVRKSRKEKNE